MKLYNSRTRQIETLTPLQDNRVSIYSCGPTVYDYVHIGNLSAFIAADTLRRAVTLHGYTVHHAMNFTDVDDKIIKKSQALYSNLPPEQALKAVTTAYSEAFIDDMKAVGNDVDAMEFIRATDASVILGMQELIRKLVIANFAYLTDDGIYFSIDSYTKSGKTYGQLVDLGGSRRSSERIANDEYDKSSVHDFALWKFKKPNEPAWEFEIEGKNCTGRPGWHIECSVMSQQTIGLPFDIHTGGIDLQFPHHENEIAQSTALQSSPLYASMFVHNEHILVEGKKMSKSLGNFYSLKDLVKQKINPLAFRMLVLQSHYRKSTMYGHEAITSAANRLSHWRMYASYRHQMSDTTDGMAEQLHASIQQVLAALGSDLDTPEALRIVDSVFTSLEATDITQISGVAFGAFISFIDKALGLNLATSTPRPSQEVLQNLQARLTARKQQDWTRSDELRDWLTNHGIAVSDRAQETRWYWL